MRVLILGSKRLCLHITERLLAIDPLSLIGLVTFDDGSDSRSALTALLGLRDRFGIDVHVARDRRHTESLIAGAGADLVIVLNWYWLLGQDCLASAPRGFIGVHMSRLPRYRGTSPVVWQIINGEPEVGFSIFSLTQAMDEGELWAQGAIPIAPDDTVSDVLASLEDAVGKAFDALFPALADESARSFPQPSVTPSYCAARLPDDGEIDFAQSALRCHNFIRAQSRPYPGAFTHIDGERLIVWRTRPLDVTYFGRPGQVARIAPEGVTVVCGDNRPLLIEAVGWRGNDLRASEVVRTVKTRFRGFPR